MNAYSRRKTGPKWLAKKRNLTFKQLQNLAVKHIPTTSWNAICQLTDGMQYGSPPSTVGSPKVLGELCPPGLSRCYKKHKIQTKTTTTKLRLQSIQISC